MAEGEDKMTEQGTFCPLFREARTVWEFNFTFFVWCWGVGEEYEIPR